MILLDTCALIFDALTPDRLSISATKALALAEMEGNLACADISLWEIAVESTRLHLPHGDPADRLIAATAPAHGAVLLTADERLLACNTVNTLW